LRQPRLGPWPTCPAARRASLPRPSFAASSFPAPPPPPRSLPSCSPLRRSAPGHHAPPHQRLPRRHRHHPRRPAARRVPVHQPGGPRPHPPQTYHPTSPRGPQALAQATGRKEEAIRAEYGESGDLGLVAARSRAAQKQMFPSPPLTVQTVGVAGVCSFSGFLCFFCGCVGGVEGRGRGL
jgi:hypothetical protein